jgi:AcrR family transcriptional regulator
MPTPSDRKPPTRRAPTQARSQHTIDAIFEATRLLAAEQGVEQLTTNAIAERAGVSIGTLYQYFSTREAVVEALVRSERAAVMRQLESLLAREFTPQSSAREVLRAFVHVYVQAFAPADRGRRALARMAWQADHLDATVHTLREASERIGQHLQRLQHAELRAPTPTQIFVLTRALMGTVRAAVIEESAVLGTSAFEEELTRVCWSLLEAD